MGGELTDEIDVVPTYGNVHGIFRAWQRWLQGDPLPKASCSWGSKCKHRWDYGKPVEYDVSRNACLNWVNVSSRPFLFPLGFQPFYRITPWSPGVLFSVKPVSRIWFVSWKSLGWCVARTNQARHWHQLKMNHFPFSVNEIFRKELIIIKQSHGCGLSASHPKLTEFITHGRDTHPFSKSNTDFCLVDFFNI